MGSRGRQVVLGLAVVILVALAGAGISGGINQTSGTKTPGQWAQTVAQLVYGVFALLLAALAIRRRQIPRIVRIGWLTSLALAAGLAPVVWGGEGVVAATAATIGGVGIGALLLWMAIVASRRGAAAPVADGRSTST